MLDYQSYFANVDPALQQALKGYQQGAQTIQTQNALEVQRLKMEQIKRAQAAAQSLQSELAAVTNKKYDDPKQKLQDLNDIITRNPALADHLKVETQQLSDQVKQNNASRALSVFAAIQNKQPEQAKKILLEDKAAAENSGDQGEASMAQGIIDMIDSGNMQAAASGAGLYASFVMGPDKVAQNYTKIQDELRKQQLYPTQALQKTAEATKAVKELSIQDLDAQLKKADLASKNIDLQIKEATSPDQIAKLKDQAQSAKLDVQLKQLQLDNGKKKEDQTKRVDAEKMGAQVQQNDLLLHDLKRFKAMIQDQTIFNPTTGIIANMLRKTGVPGTAAVNIVALKSTIVSHIALGKIVEMKNQSRTGATGFGQLSEKELQILVDSLESLDLNQTDANLIKNIGIINKVYSEMNAKMKLDPRYQDYLDYVKKNNPDSTPGIQATGQQPTEVQTTENVPPEIQNRSYMRFLNQ